MTEGMGGRLKRGTQPPPGMSIQAGGTSCTSYVQGGGSDQGGINRVKNDGMNNWGYIRDDCVRDSWLTRGMFVREDIHDSVGFQFHG